MGIFIIKNLKNTKMDEIGPWEDIDINNPYKHVSFKNTKQIEKYDLTNEKKTWLDEKLEKMKSSMDDVCLQVDGNVSHEYFSSYMKQLNDQIFFLTIYYTKN